MNRNNLNRMDNQPTNWNCSKNCWEMKNSNSKSYWGTKNSNSENCWGTKNSNSENSNPMNCWKTSYYLKNLN